MKLHEAKIISDLQNKILTQSVIIQTLVDLLVESEVISESELEDRLVHNTELLNQKLENMSYSILDESNEDIHFDLENYYGPIGEA